MSLFTKCPKIVYDCPNSEMVSFTPTVITTETQCLMLSASPTIPKLALWLHYPRRLHLKGLGIAGVHHQRSILRMPMGVSELNLPCSCVLIAFPNTIMYNWIVSPAIVLLEFHSTTLLRRHHRVAVVVSQEPVRGLPLLVCPTKPTESIKCTPQYTTPASPLNTHEES